MIIIGFTHRTSKILPRLFCRHFRHCAVILKDKENKYILIQAGLGIRKLIVLQKRDLKILEQYGWVFVKFPTAGASCPMPYSTTCVGFVKRTLDIRAPFIWTPDQLYRYLLFFVL